jgi:hypothetical protein
MLAGVFIHHFVLLLLSQFRVVPGLLGNIIAFEPPTLCRFLFSDESSRPDLFLSTRVQLAAKSSQSRPIKPVSLREEPNEISFPIGENRLIL